MSRTMGGNIFGAFVVILGCLAGYGAYRISFEWGMVIGVGVALFGAAIINPATFRAGASDFKAGAAGIAELIPLGRRSTDGIAVKLPVKDESEEQG